MHFFILYFIGTFLTMQSDGTSFSSPPDLFYYLWFDASIIQKQAGNVLNIRYFRPATAAWPGAIIMESSPPSFVLPDLYYSIHDPLSICIDSVTVWGDAAPKHSAIFVLRCLNIRIKVVTFSVNPFPSHNHSAV